MKNLIVILCFSVGLNCLTSYPIFAQEPEESAYLPIEQTIPIGEGLFDREDFLHISLKFDITEFKRRKPKEDFLDAVITFHINEEDSVSRDIKLQSRGERRNELCSFPPIRLNIEDTDLGFSDVEKVKNIKLVTHCNPPNVFDSYLYMEYLIYKMYNVVTDTSFRVRMMKIDYIDTGKRGKNESRFGFIIEPLKMVERRLEGEEMEIIPVRDYHIEPRNLDLVAMFQYVVGNSDWYLGNQHNVKIVKINKNDVTNIISIPYDFDYSGIINASYAAPNEGRPIESVKERLYLGPERSDKHYIRVMERFKQYKEPFLKLIDDFEYLDDRYKKMMTKYIESYYKDLEKGTLLGKIKYDISIQ